MKVYVFSAESPVNVGRAVISVTDFKPTEDQLWDLLEGYLKNKITVKNAYSPDAYTAYLNQYSASDFQVVELPIIRAIALSQKSQA